jgi:hypothetical protein
MTMSARITAHFYNRHGALFTHSAHGWLLSPSAPTVWSAAADARRHALASGWVQATGRRIFLRVEQAGTVDHVDLWRGQARPLPSPGRPILAQALALT